MGKPSLNISFTGQGFVIVPFGEQKFAYRVPEAARLIGISKSKMWAMIAEKKVEARKIGGSTVITHAALQALIDGAPVVHTN